MKKRKKELREKQIDEILKDVDSTNDDNKMFEAIKALHTKKKEITFENDEKGKSVSSPQEIYSVIEKYFKSQFQKQTQVAITKFTTAPKKLTKEITTEEVTNAVSKMANNKAPGEDEIAVEMFKYGPDELHSEMASILNHIFDCNDNLKLGTGILLPLPQTKEIPRTCRKSSTNHITRTNSQTTIKNFHESLRHQNQHVSLTLTKRISTRPKHHRYSLGIQMDSGKGPKRRCSNILNRNRHVERL